MLSMLRGLLPSKITSLPSQLPLPQYQTRAKCSTGRVRNARAREAKKVSLRRLEKAKIQLVHQYRMEEQQNARRESRALASREHANLLETHRLEKGRNPYSAEAIEKKVRSQQKRLLERQSVYQELVTKERDILDHLAQLKDARHISGGTPNSVATQSSTKAMSSL